MTHPSVFEAARAEVESLQYTWPAELQPEWHIPANIAIGATFGGHGNAGMTLTEYVDAVSATIDAGACAVHLDLAGVTDGHGRSLDREAQRSDAFAAVIEPLRERHGTSFVVAVDILRGASFNECLSPAVAGLAEVVPCAAGHPEIFLIPAVEVLGRSGVKVQIVVHSTGEVELAKRRLIATGILKPPYHFGVLFGTPFHTGRSLNSGVSVTDAEDMAHHLFAIVAQIRRIDASSAITVHAGGRSAFYVTTLATMMGIDICVGTRDTAWKYPHGAERLASTADITTRVRDIAALHGREPARADAYRARLGLPPPAARS